MVIYDIPEINFSIAGKTVTRRESEAPEKMKVAENDLRYLLVCQGFFCIGRGSHNLLTRLRQLQEIGALPANLAIQPYYCFNGCSHGPNVVSYPDKVWFERVGAQNVTQVIDYICKAIPATDPQLTQGRVLEVVRRNAYIEIENELNKPLAEKYLL